jgi:Raf kinase inhibitor-like YbhB/YbcL family protein
VRRLTAVAATALGCALPIGCGDAGTVEGPPPAAPATLRLTSAGFADGQAIPRRFTCAGREVSPPLAWDGVPARARALALVLEDPDAPGGTFVHWTVFDIPRGVSGLRAGQVPAGAREGENSSGERGYRGPCPPEQDRPHRYVFLVYALKSALGLDAGAPPADVRAAIGRAAIARGQLTGRYGR